VHLTVARSSYFFREEQRFGLCSAFLGQLKPASFIRFYVHRNRAFKLPPPEKDLIMIGPGTGIAPFRSFLAERDATGSTGRNWLFFGEQHFTTDFLYQTELQQWLQTGVLNRISLAFSRDQSQKIYVQHRMLEEGGRLLEWLEGGAYFYVSGNRAMAADVEETLVQQIGKPAFEKLKGEGRYGKEVY
jgi:sulfite reductase (NADPH) flavoprotein alpha-component